MRINGEIRASKVRVITEDGEQLGIMGLKQALEKAEQMNKDLVEIAPNADPPVCKIIDYGKLKYQQTKKEKENKKAQHQVKVKEIKIRPNTDDHDLKIKINHAKEFLSKGNKVKITCVFKGRELLHVNLGEKVVSQMVHGLESVATVESPSKLLGKNLTVVLIPSVGGKKNPVKKENTSAENEVK